MQQSSRLAQLGRVQLCKALNLVVVGSSPMVGVIYIFLTPWGRLIHVADPTCATVSKLLVIL